MAYSTFSELNQKMIEHFQTGEFQQAFDLAESESGRFPQDRPLVDYWRMCAAARMGKKQHVVEVAEKFFQDGFWYGEAMWRLSPSFKPLQGDVDFEKLVTKSVAIQSADLESAKPIQLEYTPENPPEDFPLLIALHGNQQSAERTLPFWGSALDAGFGLIIPQSRQAMFKGAYIWDELGTSIRQIKECFDSVKQRIKFDASKVVLAGHSMGGLIAIQMAMTGEIPVRGLIANGPALPFEDVPEELDKAIAFSKKQGLRAFFIVGEKDVDIEQETVRELFGRMKSAGISCELEIVPGAAHDYNPDYDVALLHALKFIDS